MFGASPPSDARVNLLQWGWNMSEEHDSWFKETFGVDLVQSVGKIKEDASAVLSSAASGVSRAAQAVENAVGQAADAVVSVGAVAVASASEGISAAGRAAVEVAQSFTQGAAGVPMLADCRPLRGQVPGPANHVLCATHGHVLDIDAKQVIAPSLADYEAGRRSGAGSEGSILGAALATLPLGVPTLPPGFPGMPPSYSGAEHGIRLPGDGSGVTSFETPVSSAPSGGGGLATEAVEVGKIAMEGIAVFDAAILGALVLVPLGAIAGVVMEVVSSEDIASLPGDVDTVTSNMLAGYRLAMQNGPQPSDDAGKTGWMSGHDAFTTVRDALHEQRPEASDDQVLAIVAGRIDRGAAQAVREFRPKAQEAVWISYASKHQDSAWKTYDNERFRAWDKIFNGAPKRTEKLWKDFTNDHSKRSLAPADADNDPRRAPGARNGGPAGDPARPEAAIAPGAHNVATAEDPSSGEQAEAPSLTVSEVVIFSDKGAPRPSPLAESVPGPKGGPPSPRAHSVAPRAAADPMRSPLAESIGGPQSDEIDPFAKTEVDPFGKTHLDDPAPGQTVQMTKEQQAFFDATQKYLRYKQTGPGGVDEDLTQWDPEREEALREQMFQAREASLKAFEAAQKAAKRPRAR